MEGQVPPFSPALFLGLALRPVRPSLLQPIFDTLLNTVRRRHPDILERMEHFKDAVVCIAPTDLPFVLLLEPHPEHARLTVRQTLLEGEADATIRGPLESLFALVQGRVDGDALFFSRELAIEGDTEVVVALRNAIDGAGIDLLEDLTSALGPFARPARRLAGGAFSLFGTLRDTVETVRRAMIAPAIATATIRDARLAELEEEVAALRKAVRRGAKA